MKNGPASASPSRRRWGGRRPGVRPTPLDQAFGRPARRARAPAGHPTRATCSPSAPCPVVHGRPGQYPRGRRLRLRRSRLRRGRLRGRSSSARPRRHRAVRPAGVPRLAPSQFATDRLPRRSSGAARASTSSARAARRSAGSPCWQPLRAGWAPCRAPPRSPPPCRSCPLRRCAPRGACDRHEERHGPRPGRGRRAAHGLVRLIDRLRRGRVSRRRLLSVRRSPARPWPPTPRPTPCALRPPTPRSAGRQHGVERVDHLLRHGQQGAERLLPGSFTAGWWKAADSSWCGGGYRYIVDCNATCATCTDRVRRPHL